MKLLIVIVIMLKNSIQVIKYEKKKNVTEKLQKKKDFKLKVLII